MQSISILSLSFSCHLELISSYLILAIPSWTSNHTSTLLPTFPNITTLKTLSHNMPYQAIRSSSMSYTNNELRLFLQLGGLPYHSRYHQWAQEQKQKRTAHAPTLPQQVLINTLHEIKRRDPEAGAPAAIVSCESPVSEHLALSLQSSNVL